MEWLKTSEHPFPKDGSKFLCIQGNGIHYELHLAHWEPHEEGCWQDGVIRLYDESIFHPRYVKYWMPIPSLLEDVQNITIGG